MLPSIDRHSFVLTKDFLKQVLLSLPPEDVARSALVCKLWRDVIQKENLQEASCKSYLERCYRIFFPKDHKKLYQEIKQNRKQPKPILGMNPIFYDVKASKKVQIEARLDDNVQKIKFFLGKYQHCEIRPTKSIKCISSTNSTVAIGCKEPVGQIEVFYQLINQIRCDHRSTQIPKNVFKIQQKGPIVDMQVNDYFLVSTSDQQLNVWRVPEGQLIDCYKAPEKGDYFKHLTIGTSYFDVIATLGDGVILWRSSKRLNKGFKFLKEAHSSSITHFDTNSNYLAVGSQNGEITICHLPSGKKKFTLNHGDFLSCLSIGDRGILATGSFNGVIRIWDCSKGHQLKKLTISIEEGGLSFLKVPPQNYLLMGTTLGSFSFLDIATGAYKKIFDDEEEVRDIDTYNMQELPYMGAYIFYGSPTVRTWYVKVIEKTTLKIRFLRTVKEFGKSLFYD